MNENQITMDNTFSRKELEEAFWLGYKCIGLLDYDATNKLYEYTGDIMAKRQLKHNKMMDVIFELTTKKWWNKLDPIQQQNLLNEYKIDKNFYEVTDEDIKYISDEEDGKLGF